MITPSAQPLFKAVTLHCCPLSSHLFPLTVELLVTTAAKDTIPRLLPSDQPASTL